MAEDLAVLEAQDADVERTKEAVARAVTWRCREVPRTVGFDDELGLLAIEVDDERTEGLLASELRAIEAAVAKKVPEGLLGRGGRATQGARSVRLVAQQFAHQDSFGRQRFGLRDVLCSLSGPLYLRE